MTSPKFQVGKISICLAFICAGVAFFAGTVTSTSDPDEAGPYGSKIGSLMGGMMQNMGGMGGLGGFGDFGMGDLAGAWGGSNDGGNHGMHNHDHDHEEMDAYGDDEEYGGFGEEFGGGGGRGGGGGGWRSKKSPTGGFSMKGIIGLMQSASQLLSNLPDISGIIPIVMDQGWNHLQRFLTSMPGLIRSIRPEVKRLLRDAKEPVQKIILMMKKAKRRLMGRNSWAENSVQLDLLERSLTFCPGDNMTAIEKAGIPWDSLEFQLLDRCVEAGCDGKFDLCCPYSEPRTYGLLKANCVYSLKKNYGLCPTGFKTAYFDQDSISNIMSTPGNLFPTCKMDADCEVTERCCMKEDRSKDAPNTPLASCQVAVKDNGE